MIDFLRGTAVYTESDHVVLDVHGVGYRAYCPNPYQFQTGKEYTVYMHHHVREDAILLYGFGTREEQKLFRTLLDVNGIGPRVALGMLAGSRPEAVIAAIQQENVTFLTKLPGIGKKTAQRILLDLKDKVGSLYDSDAGIGDFAELRSLNDPDLQDPSSNWAGAREGLLALGFSDEEIREAWRKLQAEISADASVDQLMKQALKQLYKA
ncbi:Holliday junction branch migration protein RuvA [Marinicrinis sediminis]|uniref:Holliday junction branch migration complex subunit RuvA n=1 Tax=Marinicrinis sediminis TaxID=1652465 RepID=A0ABW5R608_9BACL